MTFARESWPFVLPFALLAAALLAVGRFSWALAPAAAGLAILAFFRNPRRQFEGETGIVLAPADGRITRVDAIEDAELGPGRYHLVVTFLSVFDVHVQRAPAAGLVVTSRRAAGRKIAAFRAAAGAVNERHLTVIRRPNGDLVGVRQIAGLLARRVVCYLDRGDRVDRGQALGLIKFGSRVDLLVPASYQLLVREGERLRNGATPVAAPPAPDLAADRAGALQ
ncbi:MAG TPA: phosphatidylserine decarboxylase [Thermoanaerobaculia bacterium]|nr:phosphatidylserine decarboxylase [Thermoanaerobaculia bacterium]